MKTRLLTLALFCSTWAFAQQENALVKAKNQIGDKTADTTKLWVLSGLYSATITQTSLTNWASGGTSNVTVNGLVRQMAVMTKNKWVWNNLLEMNLGYNFQEPTNFKTDDKLEFTSRLDREFKDPNWRLSLFGNFRTQFFDGYAKIEDSVRTSTFMAPGYLTYGIGVTNTSIPGLSIYFSPVQIKQTFVLDDSLFARSTFFDNTIKNVNSLSNGGMRTELGAYFDAFYKKAFNENFELNSRLSLFSNYLDRPQNIDVNWESILLLKVYKNIAVSLQLQLIYDHDVNVRNATGTNPETFNAPGTQFKQILGVGVAYSYGAFKK